MPITIPETKTHQKLRSRIQYLRMHLQTVDAALQVTRRILSKSDNTKTISESLQFDSLKYDELNHPVTEQERIFAYSRSKNSEYAIIALYTHFTEYLQGILREMYGFDPIKVVGKAPKTITFAEIVNLKDYEALSKHMVESVFRSLESERSTKKLLDKILANTDAVIDETIKREALKYLEMRHIFVHRSGIADDIFATEYGQDFVIKAGDKLPTTYENARAAIEAVNLLCETIDKELLNKGVAGARTIDPQPSRTGI